MDMDFQRDRPQFVLLFFGYLPGRDRRCAGRAAGSWTGTGHDQKSDLFQDHTVADGEAGRTAHVQRDYHTGKGYFACPHYCSV